MIRACHSSRSVSMSTPHRMTRSRNEGIVGDNVVVYRLFYTPQPHPDEHPSKPLEDLLAGKIDVALVWGPWAGYFVTKRAAPSSWFPVLVVAALRLLPLTFQWGSEKAKRPSKPS